MRHDSPGHQAESQAKPLDFVVIGASKSGTTTLFNYLRHHPRLYLPLAKELPFFARDDWFERGWDRFVADYFHRASPEALWGTVTPQYLEDGVRTPQRMYQLMPQVKLVVILRNPVDRAFSTYRMRVMKGRETRSFEQVVEAQLDPAALARARQFPWHPDTATDCYLVTGEYGRALQQFAAYFPREQFQVLFTADLEQRPQFVLDAIFTFLGLEPGFSPPNLGQRYYVGGSGRRFSWLIPSLQKISPFRRLWRGFSADRKRAILWWFKTQIAVKRAAPPELPLALRRRLVEFYRPDVAALENFIGQKVPWEEFQQISMVT